MPSNNSRPLSPHLQVYRWHLTMVLSILHRMTGVVLALSFVFLVYWLLALADGPVAFDRAAALAASPLGMLLAVGVTFSFFLHLCNGIRHLAWDVGYGFELEQSYASGYAVLAGAVLLTAAVWIIAFGVIGGSA